MVLAVHFLGGPVPVARWEAVVRFVSGWGAHGVDLFFVLSGFLITGILCDTRTAPRFFRTFYARRSLRIFPLYYAVTAVFVLLLPQVWPRPSPALATLQGRQGWIWLYGVNVFDALRGELSFPYLDHFWSLAVEEQFYALWPLVVWLAAPRRLLWIALLLALGASALHVWASLAQVDPVGVYVLTPFRLDALGLGAFVAVLARRPGGIATLRRWLQPVALAAGAALLVSFAINRFSPVGLAVSRPVRGALITLLMACFVTRAVLAPAAAPDARFLSSPAMRFLGKYSYGLYVYHHLFSQWFLVHRLDYALGERIGSHGLAVILLAGIGASGSLALAILSYRFIEEPFLSLKRYFGHAPESAAGTAAT
jgi:peptidoglycan/LPS O-acetylase OafA/YrhL